LETGSGYSLTLTGARPSPLPAVEASSVVYRQSRAWPGRVHRLHLLCHPSTRRGTVRHDGRCRWLADRVAGV